MKVLVATASRHGATQEIAEAIGRTLRQHGLDADVASLGVVESLVGYDAAVVGSAVYMGHWLEPARTFVERHSVSLTRHPTWLFSSGPVGDPPRPSDEQAVAVSELVAAIHPRGHRVFAGKIDKHALGFGERAVMLAFRGSDGDYRDWDAIATWADGVAAELGRP